MACARARAHETEEKARRDCIPTLLNDRCLCMKGAAEGNQLSKKPTELREDKRRSDKKKDEGGVVGIWIMMM